MAAKEKRMLTAPSSQLGKVDLARLLRKDDAWLTLPLEVRQDLYSRLPEPRANEEAHDPSINPLKTIYKPYIEEALRQWQQDLKDGREVKKWRDEAMLAGRQRINGEFDEFHRTEKESYFGIAETEDQAVDTEGNGALENAGLEQNHALEE